MKNKGPVYDKHISPNQFDLSCLSSFQLGKHYHIFIPVLLYQLKTLTTGQAQLKMKELNMCTGETLNSKLLYLHSEVNMDQFHCHLHCIRPTLSVQIYEQSIY